MNLRRFAWMLLAFGIFMNIYETWYFGGFGRGFRPSCHEEMICDLICCLVLYPATAMIVATQPKKQ